MPTRKKTTDQADGPDDTKTPDKTKTTDEPADRGPGGITSMGDWLKATGGKRPSVVSTPQGVTSMGEHLKAANRDRPEG